MRQLVPPVSVALLATAAFAMPAAAQIRISDLPAASTVAEADATVIVQNGVTKKATAAQVRANAANPTASVGLAAVNGSATTFMRSDAAPRLDQAVSPTWTGTHSFSLVQPRTTATYDLGGSGLRWRDLWLSRNVSVGGTLGVSGTTSLSGNLTLLNFTSTANASPLWLQPSDFGVGKPALFLTKPSVANAWTIQIWDGVNNAGSLNLAAGTVAVSQAMTVGGALTVTGQASLTGGLAGVTSGAAAGAGHVGHYASANLAAGSAVTLAADTPKSVTTLALAAGDWMIHGTACVTGAGGAGVSTYQIASISGTVDTHAVSPGAGAKAGGWSTVPAGNEVCISGLATHVNIASSTTYHLVAQSGISAGTVKAYGFIGAWRIR
jgi:hypothetical protein